ncbi:MAG: Na/Pi cotransporter family protein [Treponema sp.]|jgi:phosphate:Na+ symporter|nr:Na/Pi cotransporter family protein [Treponema sp.]
MEIVSMFLRISGGLCLFLYGMKVMSEGIQLSAGERMQKALNFMTGNRFMGVLTGFIVTGIIQSSSATTVMVVSFVNAGLLTLTQSIGVIMGANIGTTVTAWIVSLVGFSLKLSELALPAVGIGFILRVIKWKRQHLGEAVLGFGLLFMGLDFLTKSMPSIGSSFDAVANLSRPGFLSNLIGMGAGFLMTLILHSSSATLAIMLTMAYKGILPYEMSAAMILGANIGTTIDAALAAIGTKIAAKRAALVHVLFNVLGTLWALPLLKPLLYLVDLVTPGTIDSGVIEELTITNHLAMLHTIFNTINALIFLPFVRQFATLVTFIIRDNNNKKQEETPEHYQFVYRAASHQDASELSILRAEKEIRDMAGIASSMYTEFSKCLKELPESENREELVIPLMEEMRKKENYADEMREVLTAYLIRFSRGENIGSRMDRRINLLVKTIAELEDMTDQCCSLVNLLDMSARKNIIIKDKELNALLPYVDQVGDFLILVREQLGRSLSSEQHKRALEFENSINESRNQLRKMGRKRIEAGKDVKTELYFMDMVRRLEKLGDCCYEISSALEKLH